MRFALAPLLTLTLLVACDTEPEGRSKPVAGRPDVRLFHTDDPEMNAAHTRARATSGVLLRALAAREDTLYDIWVKVPINTVETVEHVWLRDLRYDGRNLSGRLASVPTAAAEYGEGDSLAVRPDEISDWMIVRAGRLCGGFTYRLTRRSRLPEKRRFFDAHLGIFKVPADMAVCPPR